MEFGVFFAAFGASTCLTGRELLPVDCFLLAREFGIVDVPKRCCGLVSRTLFTKWGGVELHTVVPGCESETADISSVRATRIKLTENWCRPRGSKVRYVNRCAALAVLQAE